MLVSGTPPGSEALSPFPKCCLAMGGLRRCRFRDTHHVPGGARTEWSPRPDEPQPAPGAVAEHVKTPGGWLARPAVFSEVAGHVLW